VDEDEPAVTPRAARRRRHFDIAILVAHWVIIVAAVLMVVVHVPVDLGPKRLEPAAATGPCAAVPADVNLTVLALRPPEVAAPQAARWIECRPSSLERARDAVRWDYLLIATLTIGIGMAVVRGLRRSRWRWSAVFTLAFLAAYLAGDLAENRLLSRSLDHLAAMPDALGNLSAAAHLWSSDLRWVSAVKFGAFFAALPMFFISLAVAFGDVFGERTGVVVEEVPVASGSVRSVSDLAAAADTATVVRTFRYSGSDGDHNGDALAATATGDEGGSRAIATERDEEPAIPGSSAAPARRQPLRALFHEPEDATTPPVLPELPVPRPAPTIAPADLTMAVSCSGGGIRSAAFNLGALQALDTSRTIPGGPTEWQRVRAVSAVSGGSYMATAWVSARAGAGVDADRRWSRGSREEDHLRRHSSYIAPGFAGKVWAGLRFLLGLLVNLAFIVLAIAALALPYGWFVGGLQEPIPASGGAKIRFEEPGAWLRLPSGQILIPTADSAVRLAKGQTPHLRDGLPLAPDVTSTTETRSKTATQTDPQEAALAATLDAAANGRTLPAGSRVVLAVIRHPIRVTGRVYGCVRSAIAPTKDAECAADKAASVVLDRGTTLVRAPRAVLTTTDAGVVRRGALLRACGAHPCERVGKQYQTDKAWMLLVIAAAFGMITIAARPRERLRATHQRIFRILTGVAFALVLVLVVLPSLVSWAEGQRWDIEERSRLLGVSTLTVLIALLSQLVPLLGSGATPSSPGKAVTWIKGLGSKLRPWLVRLAAYLAAPLVLLGILLFFASFASQRELRPGQLILWLGLAGPLLVIGAGADLNQWSLHPYYRERLITAFGLDPTTMQEREPSMLGGLPPGSIPELVVCAAANVSDERVTAPGRPVLPWTFSRDQVGAPKLNRVFDPTASATVPAISFTGKLSTLQSLWTAVAVSGAAFSPSMGKMTRAERGLMAIGNVRLGIWFPNPAMLGNDPDWYQTHHPRPFYLAKEAFGLHKATDRWIYVTDGGHYENLGLVELLRRGEHAIYCFDASGDSIDTFGTMAEAMRLAREELNIEIHFDPDELGADDKTGISPFGATAAWLTRRTADGGKETYGWLVFAKLEVPKDAPFDIIDLARTLPKFPNNPTTDQLYTDQKFEAYRALGEHLGERAAAIAQGIRTRVADGDSIEHAVRFANHQYAGGPDPDPAPEWEG